MGWVKTRLDNTLIIAQIDGNVKRAYGSKMLWIIHRVIENFFPQTEKIFNGDDRAIIKP